MKKHLITIIFAALALLLLTACSHGGKTQMESDAHLTDTDFTLEMKSAGVSFDTIVCRYEPYPLFGSTLPTSYTIYADNTVAVACNIKWYDEDGIGNREPDRVFSITDEERQIIETAIRQRQLWIFEDCSDNSVTDGTSEYIILFDVDGKEIHTCGGYNPTDKRFREAADLILITMENHIGESVPMEYILSNTDLTAEDFKGIDYNAFMNLYGLHSTNIDENLNLIPDLLVFYREELAKAPTVDYSIIYENTYGTLTEADLDNLEIMLWDYHEGNLNQYMVIDFTSGDVYYSYFDDVITNCCTDYLAITLSSQELDDIRNRLLENGITQWENDYTGTDEGTTGHHYVGFAFLLTNGRCVSYRADGAINPDMPMQMEVLSQEFIDRFEKYID